MTEGPLVSVGIPCYNRPEGLRRTLECITGQTYKNLEIIISDNCSLNPKVWEVGKEYEHDDSRVKYIRQVENNGAESNFKFVLSEAKGEYFMWAADDDEWLPEFIEINLKNIENAGSCFTGYITRNRSKNQDSLNAMPEIDSQKSKYENASEYLYNITPSLVYGLHRRETISWVIESNTFDFWDCYFCLRQIIENNFNIVNNILYVAGIDAPEYIIKPQNPKDGQLLNYKDFFEASKKSILNSQLKKKNKLFLLYLLTMDIMILFSGHEKKVQPIKAVFAKGLFFFMYVPIWLKKIVF